VSGPVLRLWLPVVAWAALIFALSSVPDLGTGLGGWDTVLRKLAHAAEYAVLGALLLRASGRTGLALALGTLYAVSDELHQALVPGRLGSPVDVAIDAVGIACGVVFWQRARARTDHRVNGSSVEDDRRDMAAHSEASSERHAVAIDLDGALGDTRPLWDAWLASARELLGVDPETLPDDRAAAAAELDRRGAGNWRTLLERFSEERAAVFLRRDAATSSALRTLAAAGGEIGVFTDAPEPLARIALAQLGAARRVTVLEAGAGALEKLLVRLGSNAVVVRTGTELLRVPEDAK
jgi:VanZ family protein